MGIFDSFTGAVDDASSALPDAPDVDAPDFPDAPDWQAPDVDAPDVQLPDAPDVNAPDYDLPSPGDYDFSGTAGSVLDVHPFIDEDLNPTIPEVDLPELPSTGDVSGLGATLGSAARVPGELIGALVGGFADGSGATAAAQAAQRKMMLFGGAVLAVIVAIVVAGGEGSGS